MPNGQPKTVTAAELASLRERGEPVQILDVRSPGEYAAGHVPGAVNIPLEQVESRQADLDTRHLVVVCKSGRRAGIACGYLAGHLPGASVLEGGTDAWAAEGRPLVRLTSAKWSLERQVRLAAGLLVLAGTGLGLAVHPGWFGLAAFVGAGLTFAGLTDVCGMAGLLSKMPWNRPSATMKSAEANP
jgi:rhodanese-related sulfurtransferase